MALVQKLTGLNHTEDDGKCNNSSSSQPKQEPSNEISGDKESERKKGILNRNEDSDSSVITEENNCSSNIGENQVNSCFMGSEPVLLESPMNPYVTNLHVLPSSSNEFMCSNQPLLNYSDSLFFSSNTTVSVPSSVTLEAMKEYRDY
ncbi:VQ motif-containing protein 20-like [Sesbania bispinosa]|nr:VQ motif-containing protein 20-like [Sesbania bispinosa]